MENNNYEAFVPENKLIYAYVGGYTTEPFKGHGEGLSVFSIAPDSGEWQPLQILKEGVDISYLAIDRPKRFLYGVSESLEQVSAFAIDPQTGLLTHLNTQPTGGSTPASLSLDPSDHFLVIANYFGGTVAVLPVEADGKVGPVQQLITLEGQPGPDKVEQYQSHPHDVVFDPTGRYVFIPDKGFDRVFIFSFDSETGQLSPAEPAFITEQSGAGPRHLAFHPGENYAYLINELNSTITVFSYGTHRPTLYQLQMVSTLPPDFNGNNTCAEITVAPSGKFVYGSNRGHDSIAVYAVDEATGQLTPIQWMATGGRTPRFFGLGPTGTLLYAANQDSDNITVFEVDPENGTLAPTGEVVQTGSPNCIAFNG